LLFTISNQEHQEDVLKARANLKSVIAETKAAELDLYNTKQLVDKNVISRTELEIAASKLSALQARIEEARSHEASAALRLSFTNVRAPFDGMIDRIPNKAGSLINEGDLLTTISDNRQVFAYFNVSEREYLEYADNLKVAPARTQVELVLANNEMHPQKGIIETTESQFDKNTGTIAFRARFPNPERILKHGSSGKVRLQTRIENAIVIPQKTAFEIQDKIYVYVVDHENIARMRSFVPGRRMPHLYIVEDGLSTRDRIVYEGIQDIREGMRLQTRNVQQTKLINELSLLKTEKK
jgi:RND family efflux transporter MFP subunit